MVNLVEVGHIGVGLDFCRGLGQLPQSGEVADEDILYNIHPPEGLRTITDLPNMTQGLVGRDHSEAKGRRILGLDFLGPESGGRGVRDPQFHGLEAL